MERSKEIDVCIVCHNVDCAARGSIPIGEELTKQLAAAGSSVRVVPHLCFSACEEGPNIVLYPQGTWYKGAQMSDVGGIVAHIQGGEPVQHLIEDVDPALRDLILTMIDMGLVDF